MQPPMNGGAEPEVGFEPTFVLLTKQVPYQLGDSGRILHVQQVFTLSLYSGRSRN